jgi:UrcA family protein
MTTFNSVSPRFATKTTMSSLGSTSCLAAILMLSIGMLGGAAAQADQPKISQHVKFSDLDLATAEGQQRAQARVHEVARTLCSRVADQLDLSHQQNYVKCIDTAVAKAGEQLQALINRQSASKLAQADVK